MSADASFDVQDSHPVFRTLAGLAEEFRGVVVRLIAYVCGILALALLATDLMSRIIDDMDMAPMPAVREVAWRPVERPVPAFSVSGVDFAGRTATYDILRHTEGGRKDILRWNADDAMLPAAQVEIYRPGDEWSGFAPTMIAVAERVMAWNAKNLQAIGVVETKFGAIPLVGFEVPSESGRIPCTAFVQPFERPLVQVAGFSCQPSLVQASRQPSRDKIWMAQRQAVACLLNRLTLLTAGSEPELATFFAHAELNRGSDCSGANANADWISAAERPQLRGARD